VTPSSCLTPLEDLVELFIEDEDFIPLLSGRTLADFTPESFKAHVRGLHKERRVRKRVMTRKPYKLTARKLKSGKVSLKTKRERPKYITPEELKEIESRFSIPANEAYLLIQSEGFSVFTHLEAKRVRKEIEEIPW